MKTKDFQQVRDLMRTRGELVDFIGAIEIAKEMKIPFYPPGGRACYELRLTDVGATAPEGIMFRFVREQALLAKKDELAEVNAKLELLGVKIDDSETTYEGKTAFAR